MHKPAARLRGQRAGLTPLDQVIAVEPLGGLYAFVVRQRWSAEHGGALCATIGAVLIIDGPFALRAAAEACRERMIAADPEANRDHVGS